MNNLLARQIKKYLSGDLLENDQVQYFIKVVNDSYKAYEKDQALSEHAFSIAEQEYAEMNERLKEEVISRRQGIKSLKVAIRRIDSSNDNSDLIDLDEDNLTATLAYLNEQISQRKKMEEELKNSEYHLIEAREQAEQFSKSKEHFLANMSHEIRTPMNAVLGMAGQLAKTNLDSKQRFYLDTIHSASENLLVIINDILDLTKIKAGKISLEKIGFRPEPVFARALQVMMHKAEEKGLIMKTGNTDSSISPVLIGDPYRLNQVLLNLLSNAIKFTGKGRVDLSCIVIDDNVDEQKLLIQVTDTGIGMDEHFMKNLFEKFAQEYESVTRKFGGTGLGMSICKELIELMGGQINVSSKKEVGTTISILLTLPKGTPADLPSADTTPINAGLLANKKILVVDDNDMNRLVATTILDNYGITIFEAANGREAVDFLMTNTVDIVMMDIQMPVMSGLEASEIIRREISATLPIIALTANAIKGESDKCINAGMNDYLYKPFDEDQFIKIISTWLGRQIPVEE